MPSAELLARVAQRDPKALGELYDRYAPRLLGVLALILPARRLAEEVLQDVFLRLWEEAPSLHHEGASVGAWLVLMAREAALDYLAAEKSTARASRATRTLATKSVAAKPGVGPSLTKKPLGAKPLASTLMAGVPRACLPRAEEIGLIDERLGLLHRAVNQLPRAQREVLELAVFKGHSEAEIAQELGEPEGKVKAALRAAITFVRHRRHAVVGTWAVNI